MLFSLGSWVNRDSCSFQNREGLNEVQFLATFMHLWGAVLFGCQMSTARTFGYVSGLQHRSDSEFKELRMAVMDTAWLGDQSSVWLLWLKSDSAWMSGFMPSSWKSGTKESWKQTLLNQVRHTYVGGRGLIWSLRSERVHDRWLGFESVLWWLGLRILEWERERGRSARRTLGSILSPSRLWQRSNDRRSQPHKHWWNHSNFGGPHGIDGGTGVVWGLRSIPLNFSGTWVLIAQGYWPVQKTEKERQMLKGFKSFLDRFISIDSICRL